MAAVLLAGGSALAQPAAPPAAPAAAERDRLALEFAGAFLDALDPKAIVEKAMAEDRDSNLAKDRPEWVALQRDAVLEELDAARPKLARVLARHYGQQLTAGELKVGIAFLQSPGVAEFYRASFLAGEAAPMPSQAAKAFDRLDLTDDGRGFFYKFAQNPPTDAVAADLAAAVVPGALRRFGEKAEAAEAARQAAGPAGGID